MVTVVEQGGRVEHARLGFRFDTLVFPDQSRVDISTDAIFQEGQSPGHKLRRGWRRRSD